MEPLRFMRKPFFVTGYPVTEENMEKIAKWCEGHVVKDIDGRSFVRVPVNRPTHDLQTKAYAGMFVLLSQKEHKRTYKVYDQEWLDKNFIEMDPEFSDHKIPDDIPDEPRGRRPSTSRVSRPTPLTVNSQMLKTPPGTVRRGSTNGAAEFLAAS